MMNEDFKNSMWTVTINCKFLLLGQLQIMHTVLLTLSFTYYLIHLLLHYMSFMYHMSTQIRIQLPLQLATKFSQISDYDFILYLLYKSQLLYCASYFLISISAIYVHLSWYQKPWNTVTICFEFTFCIMIIPHVGCFIATHFIK